MFGFIIKSKVTYWDTLSKRANSRTSEGKSLNVYLDQVYSDLLECQKQLVGESKYITAQAIKARYLGEDEQHKTLLQLVSYHNKNMVSELKPSTCETEYPAFRGSIFPLPVEMFLGLSISV